MILKAAASVAALALVATLPATAQTTAKTEVKTETGTKDGVPTRTTKVTHVRKHKTHRAKRILGVKVGTKTRVAKTVRTTTTSADGDKSVSVKTTTK